MRRRRCRALSHPVYGLCPAELPALVLVVRWNRKTLRSLGYGFDGRITRKSPLRAIRAAPGTDRPILEEIA